MKRNGVLAVVFVLCVMSSSMLQEAFAADPADPGCYDSCNMGCVQYFNNQRLFSRCDRKCQIICSPDSQVQGNFD